MPTSKNRASALRAIQRAGERNNEAEAQELRRKYRIGFAAFNLAWRTGLKLWARKETT